MCDPSDLDAESVRAASRSRSTRVLLERGQWETTGAVGQWLMQSSDLSAPRVEHVLDD